MKIVGIQDIHLDQLGCREDTFKPHPFKQTTTVKLVVGDREKVTNVGSLFSSTEQRQMLDLLQSNSDVFAWSAADITWIPSSTITRPVRLIKRKFVVDRMALSKRKPTSY